MKNFFEKTCIDYCLLIFAGLLYAIALNYFVLPSKVILSGTEGIAASISYFFDNHNLFIYLYVLFQSLLLVFAFFWVTKTFAIRSLTVIITVVIGLSFLPALEFADPRSQNERIILVIFGGLLAGVAKAIAFQRRGSTADEDIIGAYFAMKYLKLVGFVAIIAGIVSTLFGLVLDYYKNGQIESLVNTLMYTSIYIFMSAETLNNFYRKFKLAVFIVFTKDPINIGAALNSTSEHRTFTIQHGIGGRTGDEFKMLRTIVTHEELEDVIDAVEKVDQKCFYYHHDIEGVSGNYYIKPIG
jgi:uncharacterized membrane-anchored protein YitT (DUF2179 family)